MAYDLKIKQSYNGNGGKEGYKYKLYDIKGKKLGKLKNVPTDCHIGATININGLFYIVSRIYESPKSKEEQSEVIYYELNKYEFKPDFNLELISNA